MTSGHGSLAGLETRTAEVLVVGAGAAGLATALGCAPRAVSLLTKARLGEGGSTAWAQGGIAAAVGPGDGPALHAADTLVVAGGLGDPQAVAALTAEGPGRVAALLALGSRFDRTGRGAGLALGREAAHSRHRILHARGDATGAELMRALTAAVRRSRGVRVEEESFAVDLVLDEHGRVAGVVAIGRTGRPRLYLAPAVVLATGGIGQLYRRTTNPRECTGDGLAMAARAGARLVDLEMVQFHPTALAAGPGGGAADPMPLVSEAVRGEGAVLVDGAGRRVMAGEHPLADLAPRDVVARVLYRRSAAGEPVYLDARDAVGGRFPRRFPTVYAACRRAGIDPRRQPIPVSPAAHYHMGGIDTDLDGRTSLPGLWACGETASTGAHGANRLASNSLLEALVFAARVAEDLRSRLAAVPGGAAGLGRLRSAGGVLPDAAAGAPARAAEIRRRLRDAAWRDAGLVRSAAGLATAGDELERLAEELGAPVADPAALETHNLLAAGRLVVATAALRRESRGAHYRDDFPDTDPAWRRRLRLVREPDGALREVAAPRLAAAAGGAGR